MQTHAYSRYTDALTKLECLIVVLGIVLISGMLLPSLSSPGTKRRAYKRGQCLNNMKQLGTSYQMWLIDVETEPPKPLALDQSLEARGLLLSTAILQMSN